MSQDSGSRPDSVFGGGTILYPLSAHRILEAWERGEGRSAGAQAQILLDCATPAQSRAALAALPLGQRDRLLLRLRARTLGPILSGRVSCPDCGCAVSFSVDIGDIEAACTESPGPAGGQLTVGDYELQFRLLTAADLDRAGQCASVDEAEARLLYGCILDARYRGHAIDVAALPEAVLEALSEELERRDPLIETALAVNCDACSQEWHALLEIGAFFFREIEDCANRLLRDVHDLASSYHWSEAELLSMSSLRRQRYLELTL